MSVLQLIEWKAQPFCDFTGQASSTKASWWGLKNRKSWIMGHRPTFFFFFVWAVLELFASPEILQSIIPALGLSSFTLHACQFPCDFSWVYDSVLMRLQCRELTCPCDTVNEQWQFVWVQNSCEDLYQLSEWFVNHCKPNEWRITYLSSAVSYLNNKNVREQLCDISSFTSHKVNESQAWLPLQFAEIRTFHLQNTNPTNKQPNPIRDGSLSMVWVEKPFLY